MFGLLMYQQEAATFSLGLSFLVDVHQSSNHDDKDGYFLGEATLTLRVTALDGSQLGGVDPRDPV
jgi:hypothetical protein